MENLGGALHGRETRWIKVEGARGGSASLMDHGLGCKRAEQMELAE